MTRKLVHRRLARLIACGLLAGGTASSSYAQEQNVSISHQTAQVNGVKYHYVLSGPTDAEAVILLHGFPTTWTHWERIIPELAEKYLVIAPDLRGLGLTERPANGYDKRTVAEDIYQLLRHLDNDRAYVVAHDIGAMVAFALAHEHPESVRKLVILDTPVPVLPGWETSPGLWWGHFHQVPDLPELLVSDHVQDYLEYFFTLSAYNPTAIGEEELAEYVQAYSRPGALRAAFNYYRAFGEDARVNEIYTRSKLQMPVLALGGGLSTGEITLRNLQAVADNVQGGSIEKSGHWLVAEQPTELLRRLLAFFAQR